LSKYLPLNLFVRQALLYPLVSPFLPPVNKVENGYSYGAGKLIGELIVAAALWERNDETGELTPVNPADKLIIAEMELSSDLNAENIIVASDKALHLGPTDINGSWKLIRNGTAFIVQRRESGNWVEKGAYLP